MGHQHPERPFVSRRQFLRGAITTGAAVAAGPAIWRQLAYAAETPVRHVHTTFGADASRERAVSWMTPGPVRDPFVELAGTRLYAQTVQYAGYPGYFHHARLTGMEPGALYAYAVGHADTAWTQPSEIVAGPAGRAPFRFTAFGDQGIDMSGIGVPPVAQPPNQASANTALAQSMRPAFHAIVGDLAYANGDQRIWDDWFTMIEPMARATPWMPCIGNHEIESQLDLTRTGESWGDWGYDPYRTRFALPSNGFGDLQNCFYAFRYGSVQFVSVDNNDVNTEVRPNIGYTGGRQRAWVEQQLAAARSDSDVDFIVVLSHQCAFSSSSKHGSDPGVREAWGELFARYTVDLVLQGHDHVYERTHAMSGELVAVDSPPYRTDVGTVYATVGNGGAVQEPFNPGQPAWSAFRQDFKVGTLVVEVEPFAAGGMKRLVLSEYSALDGSPIEANIVLERPQAVAAPSQAALLPAGAAATSQAQQIVLPRTGPSGPSLVGVGALAAGLGIRLLVELRERDTTSRR